MKPIVVYAPSFDEKSGGAIALHYLVDRLRATGVEAYIYPFMTLNKYPQSPVLRALRSLRTYLDNVERCRETLKQFETHPSMNVPFAPRSILRKSIVVYPEIIPYNPLNAKHVVRWLLHKPGFFKDDVEFGNNELTFFYQHAFCEGLDWVDPENHLRIRWIRNDIYFDRGENQREGACRLIRKGALTGSFAPENDGAVLIDDMSHEEKAAVFNRTKVFYCHDPYTMYSFYAALCGCTSVVVPQEGLSSTEWRSTYAFKHGIAYGQSEAEWAKNTRDDLLEESAAQTAAENDTLKRFIKQINAKFGG